MEVRTGAGKKIVLEASPLAKGGEGAVHRIRSAPYDNGHCAKLYFPAHRKDKAPKLRRMVELAKSHPPTGSKQVVGCWPEELIYQGRELAGFLMPMAFPGSILLYELTRPRMNQTLGGKWQSKFARTTPDGVEARIKLCLNLCAAVHHVHSLGLYTFVDLKPQNVLVTNDGRVSLIDLDSMQIARNGHLEFPARVTTAEYAPKDPINIVRQYVPEYWDRFALAVIIYEILTGIHPYAGSFSGPYQNVTNIADAIGGDLFVFGNNARHVKTRPKPHETYRHLPETIQSLFQRAFDGPTSARPNAAAWGEALFAIIGHQDQAKAQSRPVSQAVAQTAARMQPRKRSDNDGAILLWLIGILVLIAVCYIYTHRASFPTINQRGISGSVEQPEDWRWRASVHEAAHITAALALGYGVDWARIYNPAAGGETRRTGSLSLEHEAQIGLAGYVAEKVFLGVDSLGHSRDDLDNLRNLMSESSIWSQESATAELLNSHQDALVAIAYEIHAYRRISGSRARELFQRFVQPVAIAGSNNFRAENSHTSQAKDRGGPSR